VEFHAAPFVICDLIERVPGVGTADLALPVSSKTCRVSPNDIHSRIDPMVCGVDEADIS
jgi:hypothetical protein